MRYIRRRIQLYIGICKALMKIHCQTIIITIILIYCVIALKEVPLTPGPEAVSIVAYQSRVYRESNAIPVHPNTAGSAKLSEWLIREAEENLENNIRGP